MSKKIYFQIEWKTNTLVLTSLFDNLHEFDNDISSPAVDCIGDEELNSDVFDVVDGIWSLVFFFNGLRDGIAGGMSSADDWDEGSTIRLYFLCEGDNETGCDGIKSVFDDWWWSFSNVVLASIIDKLWSFWSVVRPGFRLN